ncbi:MAG TPA: CoA transferase, partial [Xanthobacteraceae bacterium]|nr:CoA transferase [Xanthobacteraceae bacterium]
MSTRTGPLVGLKVIELCHVMAGPTCGLMLADMGADVIKIERIPGGDDTRRQRSAMVGDEAAAFLMMNRNKRGIAVDLKTAGGKAVLRRLLPTADVVTENYRRGVMERMGFGYDDLRQLNPRLIYCAITGFGRTGPYAERGGFDLVAQGMSGLMSITGEGPGRPPVKVGAPVCDITAGLLGCMGVLAALHHRDRTGEGQMIDTSLFEAGVTHTYWQSAIALATGVAPAPMGSAHPLSAPYQAFATRDGWITCGAATQPNWLRLLDVLDAPHIRDDPRFATNADRMKHLDALAALLAVEFRKRPSGEWLDMLERA